MCVHHETQATEGLAINLVRRDFRISAAVSLPHHMSSMLQVTEHGVLMKIKDKHVQTTPLLRARKGIMGSMGSRWELCKVKICLKRKSVIITGEMPAGLGLHFCQIRGLFLKCKQAELKNCNFFTASKHCNLTLRLLSLLLCAISLVANNCG